MKVWFVGKPNVGKSTLFNILSWSHRAIVTEISWTTREIVTTFSSIDEKNAMFLDSPWYDDKYKELEYIDKIIEESDLLVFVVDHKEGYTSFEEEITQKIIKAWKKSKTLLIVNKFEKYFGDEQEDLVLSEYYSLGFEKVIPASATQKKWIENIKDALVSLSSEYNIEDQTKQDFHNELIILGRPNVGKSTMLNKLVWEETAKVEEYDWTTLDYIQWEVNFRWNLYCIYDTAWVRKRWNIHWLEKIAYHKTLSLIDYKRPVCIVLIDANEWLTHRDKTIIWDLINIKVPILIAVNKMDLLSYKDQKILVRNIQRMLWFIKYSPIIPISSKTWYNLDKIIEFSNNLREEYNKRVPTSSLNNVLSKAWLDHPPRFPKSKICKFYYATQIEAAPPTFLIFVNNKEKVNFAFKKWIENNIRKNFGFIGVPLVIGFRNRDEKK